MKIFISQPMRGFSKEEIIAERKRIEAMFSGNEFIDSMIDDIPEDTKDRSLWCLGESIKRMADADMVVVPEDAYAYRGCFIERRTAELYEKAICMVKMYPNISLYDRNKGVDICQFMKR